MNHKPTLRGESGESSKIDPIVLQRVHLSLYYKQHLATANEAKWLSVAARTVHYIGGIDNSNRPSPFLSCLVRLVELAPEIDVIDLFLTQHHFKYVTALALAYVRLTQPPTAIIKHLQVFSTDYRKLRQYLSVPENNNGISRNYGLSFLDSFSDELLHSQRLYGIYLPTLPASLPLMVVPRSPSPDIDPHVLPASDSD